jgi:hypothetical protein
LWFKPPQSVKVLVQSSHVFDAEYGTADGNVAIRIERVIEPPEDRKSLDSSESHHSEESVGAEHGTPAQRKRA